jgi:hypothetical protein
MADDIGLILRCNKCSFVEESGARYIAGQVKNDAKQAITGYVLEVDLQDAKGTSVKKIPLMLMSAMALQAGETKDFKDRLMSTETNVTQAVVYFKKAGKEVKLSDSLTLKKGGPAVSSAPVKALPVKALPARLTPAGVSPAGANPAAVSPAGTTPANAKKPVRPRP